MARVQGMKERLHMPQYDSLRVKDGQALQDALLERGDSRVMRFFVDVQGKTLLETNLQSSGVLPSLNAFEVRALRVVVSPPSGRGQVTPPAVLAPAMFVSELIFRSVTTLHVAEKMMLAAPTFFFPSGAGVFGPFESAKNPDSLGALTSHGGPDPQATFRLAEPILIEPQQNFRVELSFPHGLSAEMLAAVGELWIWVILDGYLTRDVQ